MTTKVQKLIDSMTNDYAEEEVEKLMERTKRGADEIDKAVPKKKGGALDFNNIKKDSISTRAPKIPNRKFPKY